MKYHFYKLLLLVILAGFFNLNMTGQGSVKLLGNTDENLIRVSKIIDNYLYLGIRTGSSGQAVVVKQDLNCNEIWTQELAENLSINDFTKRDDTLMIVGSSSTAPLDAFIAKIVEVPSPSVAFIKLYDFNATGATGERDSYSRIVNKPNSNINYYVQTYFLSNTGSSDDLGVLEMDGNGDLVTSNFYHIADDQYWSGLRDGGVGYTLIGNGSEGPGPVNGGYLELNNDLSINEAYNFTDVWSLSDFVDRTPTRKIVVGYENLNGLTGLVMQVGAAGNVDWAFTLDESRTISSILFLSATAIGNGTVEEYLVTGDYDTGNGFKPYVAKFKNTITSGDQSFSLPTTQSLEWVKILEDGSSIQQSIKLLKENNKLFYLDQRNNTTDGFGGLDVLQAITDLELNSCITQILDWNITDFTTASASMTFTQPSYTYPAPTTLIVGSVQAFDEAVLCEPLYNCEASCDVMELDFSTGYDINGVGLPTNMHQSKWQVVSTPAGSGVNAPMFPFILPTPSAWSNIPLSKYISPLPNIQSNFNNLSTNTSFDFEQCFCVCADDSEVTIDLSAYADNALNVDLYDGSFSGGSFIMDLLDISSSEGTGAFNGATFDANHVLTLAEGQYCMKAQLQNDGSTYMGWTMNATVSGAGLISDECCGTATNGLTGVVYDDKNCNGQYDMSTDALHAGAVMTVCDDQGVDVASVTTDDYGLYTFADLGAGEFTVKYTLETDFEVVQQPVMPLTLIEGQVIGSLNFGLNYTGPVTTVPFTSTCLQAGSNFTFEWCGQMCDCTMEILTRPCGSMDEYEVIGAVPNTRKFTWMVPSNYMGDFEFIIRDCDGNEIPFDGCLSVVDYDLEILFSKVDCGVYEFGAELIGSSTGIASYAWTFGDYQVSSDPNPTIEFNMIGVYQVCLTITTTDGCKIKECMSLNVTEAFGDDCSYCPAEVMSEIDQGDLFIYDDCYGVIITSPNGSCFRIKVGDDGTLYSEPIECPLTGPQN